MRQDGDLKPFMRLDQVLVDRGLMPSRSRAADAILRKTVRIDGILAQKASQKVGPDANIIVDDPAEGYVSRAALKLKAGLDIFSYEVSGRHCLDIGASTGGFSQVLLEAGAAHIFAIDVGHDQIHPSLKLNKNLTLREGLNIRNLDEQDFIKAGLEPKVEAIVCDVSFISLKLALPAALKFATPGAWAILLVKPQFEVGRDGLGKGGLVRDEESALQAAQGLATWLATGPGWRVETLMPCPITGADGNQEYLLGARFK